MAEKGRLKRCTSVPLKSLSALPSGIKWVLRVTVRIVIREIKNRQSVRASAEKIKKIFPQTEKKTHKKIVVMLKISTFARRLLSNGQKCP
jgi:hypothetical protein